MKNRVFVFGGTGFIGRNIVSHLCSTESEVVFSGRSNEPSFESPGRYVQGSLEHCESVLDAISECDDLVIVGCPSKPASNAENFVHELDRHVRPMICFLDRIDWSRLRSVIYISSGGTIYSGARESHVESEAPAPTNFYGAGKTAIEDYLRIKAAKAGAMLRIVRPSNPVGRFQKYGDGQGVVPVLVNCAVNVVEFQVFGDGSVVRDYFDIRDLMRGIELLIDYRGDEETFNFGSGSGLSILEVIDVIERCLKKKLKVCYKEARGCDAAWSVLNCDKAKKHLGWSTEYSLEQAVLDYVAHEESNGLLEFG